MKLIFLDCDGVINGSEWFAKHSSEQANSLQKLGFNIDPACKRRVKSIIEKTGCKIVWSSSWRHLGKGGVLNPELVRKTWEFIGFNEKDLYSWTPWLHLAHARSVEITQWLDEHPEVFGKALIIDDGRSAYVNEDYKEGLKIKFINTDRKFGLTEEEMNEAIEWLNAEE